MSDEAAAKISGWGDNQTGISVEFIRHIENIEHIEVMRQSTANNATPYPYQWDHWGAGTPYY